MAAPARQCRAVPLRRARFDCVCQGIPGQRISDDSCNALGRLPATSGHSARASAARLAGGYGAAARGK